MLPQIFDADANGFDVIIMNPNYNRDPLTKVRNYFNIFIQTTIPKCHSMEDHAKFVWKKYIMDSKHDELYIIAHSAGGSCLGAIQKQFNRKQEN